ENRRFSCRRPRAASDRRDRLRRRSPLKRRFEMILKECVTDRLSSKHWMGVSLIALIIMPLSVRAIWAEPTKHEDSQANVTTTTASDAGESKPSDAVARPPATIEERLPA